VADPNTESAYSGVISLLGILLIIFLDKLNKHALWGADVGNSNLESRISEQMKIIEDPEFGTL
jgi:hypothetical protein